MRSQSKMFFTIIFFISNITMAGDSGGSGGDYADEFDEFRSYVLRIHEAERTKYQTLFAYSDDQFDAAQKRLERVILRRKDKPGFLTVDGKEISIIDLLPKPIDELFVIDGAPKTAINLQLASYDLVLFDVEEWEKLEGKVRNSVPRKLHLMGHELYGILELEQTGERHFSRNLNLDALRGTPLLTSEDIPVVPLWSAPFSGIIPIGMNEDCWSPSSQKRLRKLIGQRCLPQLPQGIPAPFFSYECAFEGKLKTPVKTGYKVSYYKTKAWVPGTFEHYHRHGSSFYFYQSSEEMLKIFRRSYEHGHRYRPGYWIERSKTTYTPVQNKYCRIKGDIFLTGIDPIMAEEEPELLASSENTWEEEIVFPLLENPEQYVKNQCFAYRKKIRKGLFEKSRCVIRELNGDNLLRWELWGIHPYRTPYKFEGITHES